MPTGAGPPPCPADRPINHSKKQKAAPQGDKEGRQTAGPPDPFRSARGWPRLVGGARVQHSTHPLRSGGRRDCQSPLAKNGGCSVAQIHLFRIALQALCSIEPI